jgi:hypothetical protein
MSERIEYTEVSPEGLEALGDGYNYVAQSGLWGTDGCRRHWLWFTEAQCTSIVHAFPRAPGFEEEIIQAFYDGIKHKPETTFGTINTDVLADKDPHFHRTDLCSRIRNSRWTIPHATKRFSSE